MIDVAVVGLGWWGQHIQRLLTTPDAPMRVVATVDPDPSQHTDHARLDEVLERDDVRAVILCTPHAGHPEQIFAAASAEKHIFCEKPLALHAADAALVVQRCREQRLVLGIGHERRFEPAMAAIKHMVSNEELGVVMHVEAAFSHDKFVGLNASSWRGASSDAPAAGMTGMGIHLTDAFVWMFGRVSKVHTFIGRRVLPLESGDVASVHLEFESGALGALSVVSATPFFARYAVFGSEGWVESRERQHPEEGVVTSLTHARRGDHRVTWDFDRSDPVVSNLRAFADAVAGQSAYPFTGPELVHNIEVLEAIVRSAASGSPVEVRDSD